MALVVNQVSRNEAVIHGDAHLIRQIVETIEGYNREAVTGNCGGTPLDSRPTEGLAPPPTVNWESEENPFRESSSGSGDEYGNRDRGNAPKPKAQEVDRALGANQGVPTEGPKPTPSML